MSFAEKPGSDSPAGLGEAARLLEAYSAIVAPWGFGKPEITTDHSALVGDSVMGTFYNAGLRIRLLISVFSGTASRNGSFVVTFRRRDGQMLDVVDFLKSRGKADLAARFSDRKPTEDLAAFTQECLNTLTQLLNTELRPIAEGTAWESTPFDWHGYK